MEHADIMALCCQSNVTFFWFWLFLLRDVGHVAVTDCFKLKVFLHISKNWIYRPRRHRQYCVSAEKQLGMILLVTCNVAVQSKSAQICSPKRLVRSRSKSRQLNNKISGHKCISFQCRLQFKLSSKKSWNCSDPVSFHESYGSSMSIKLCTCNVIMPKARNVSIFFSVGQFLRN